MSDWYPHAVRRELSFAHTLPARQNAASAVIHTNGGKTGAGGDLHDWWESQYRKTGDRICCHLQVGWAKSFQYVDSTRQAFAAYDSNPFAFQIETEDDGDPNTPWNDYQVTTIVDACFWQKVPARISPDNASGGVGWHQQYANWNQKQHNCPGRVRVEQIHDLVIPQLAAAYSGEDMPLNADDKKWIHDTIAAAVAGLPLQTAKQVWGADIVPTPAQMKSAKTNETSKASSLIGGLVNTLLPLARKSGIDV